MAFYVDPERLERDGMSSRPDFGVGLAESLKSRSNRSVSVLDLPALRADLAESFRPVAERLGDLELVSRSALHVRPWPYGRLMAVSVFKDGEDGRVELQDEAVVHRRCLAQDEGGVEPAVRGTLGES